MSKKNKNTADSRTLIAANRKARYNYEILETLEAGLVLLGSEVKSMRLGKANLLDSYATEEQGEIWLINAHIPTYNKARENHQPTRSRKLLLHARQRNKLIGLLRTKGVTLVPLSLYFNERGIAKVELAIAKGKSKYDKRETEKKRDWEREKARLMRE